MTVEAYNPEPLALATVPPAGNQLDTPCGSYIKSSRDRTIYYLDFNIRQPEPSTTVATYTREFLLLKHRLLLDEWWRRHTFACRRFPLHYASGGERCILVGWAGLHVQPLKQRLWELQASWRYWKYIAQLDLLHSLESNGTPIANITRHTSLRSTELPAAMFDFPDVPGYDYVPEVPSQYKDLAEDLRTDMLDPEQEDVIKARACCSFATLMRPLQAHYGASAATTSYKRIQKPFSAAVPERRIVRKLSLDGAAS